MYRNFSHVLTESLVCNEYWKLQPFIKVNTKAKILGYETVAYLYVMSCRILAKKFLKNGKLIKKL